MSRSSTHGDVEADLVALRAAAERAGMALACLFSSSDEFEAAVIEARRAGGAFRLRRLLLLGSLTALLAAAFIMM
jgi:hypothetical protein